jgi:hypothetical protein
MRAIAVTRTKSHSPSAADDFAPPLLTAPSVTTTTMSTSLLLMQHLSTRSWRHLNAIQTLADSNTSDKPVSLLGVFQLTLFVRLLCL